MLNACSIFIFFKLWKTDWFGIQFSSVLSITITLFHSGFKNSILVNLFQKILVLCTQNYYAMALIINIEKGIKYCTKKLDHEYLCHKNYISIFQVGQEVNKMLQNLSLPSKNFIVNSLKRNATQTSPKVKSKIWFLDLPRIL